jgi:hypothetical protein
VAGSEVLGTDHESLATSYKPGAVAQLGERLICTQEVAGSIPTSSTKLEPLRAKNRVRGGKAMEPLRTNKMRATRLSEPQQVGGRPGL